MLIDENAVRYAARLACIAVTDDEVCRLQGEFEAILQWLALLKDVNMDDVEPMVSVVPMDMKRRQDVVDDGGIADDLMAGAPHSEGNFFIVPKMEG